MTRLRRLTLAVLFMLLATTGCGSQTGAEIASVATVDPSPATSSVPNGSQAGEETTHLAALVGFRPADYEKAVEIELLTGVSEYLRSVRVLNEDDSSVTIEIRVTDFAGTSVDIAMPSTLTVSLQRVLGQRQVLEPGGERVRRLDSPPSAEKVEEHPDSTPTPSGPAE